MQQPPAPQGGASGGHQPKPVDPTAATSTAARRPTSAQGAPERERARRELSALWARFSADEVRAGLQMVEAATAVEPRVTQLLRGSVLASGARLEGLESPVKSPAAVVAAIHERLVEVASAGVDVAAVAESQRDALRYVVVCPDAKRFAEVVRASVGSLETAGASVVSVLDLFRPGTGYQGLHVVLRLSAVVMEVRFHSSASWQAWRRSKAAYEVIRDPDQSWQHRERAMTEARAQFREVVSSVKQAELSDLSGVLVRKR